MNLEFEYKLRQYIFHKTQITDDYLNEKDYLVCKQSDEELIEQTFKYFTHDFDELIFPAKSFSVAIIYSTLIEKYFGIDKITSLMDQELFLGTDKFFKVYSANTKNIYENVFELLDQSSLWDFENSNLKNVQKTVQYFKQEFF